MFKSRNNSRNQSTENLDEINTIFHNADHDDVSLQVELDERDIEIFNDPRMNTEILEKYSRMCEEAEGRCLLRIIEIQNRQIKESKSKAPLINVVNEVIEYTRRKDEEKRKNDIILQKGLDQIRKEVTGNVKSIGPVIANKYLPPPFFSEEDVLVTITKAAEAHKLFPKDRHRYTGEKDKGPTLGEFIYHLNNAQEKCKLSLKEFKERLLLALTGEAYEQMQFFIKLENNVGMLYQRLTLLFDKSAPAETHRTELINYRANKWETLAMVQSHILKQATLANANCPNPEQRLKFINNDALFALPRSLPAHSSGYVTKKLHEIMQTTQDPSFTDLCKALELSMPTIDNDIQQNGLGHTREFKKFGSQEGLGRNFRTFRRPSAQTVLNRVNATQAVRQDQRSYNRKQPNKKVINQQGQTKYMVHNISTPEKFKNNFTNKMHCLLCGKNTHTSTMGCYSMRDSSGRVVENVNPSQDPCAICQTTVGKRLFHPQKYCFNRNTSSQTYAKKRPQ